MPFRRWASSAQSGQEIGLPAVNARGSGFVVLAVLVLWAMGGLGELSLSGKGLVALTLGFLFTAASAALASRRSSSSAAAAIATPMPIGRPSAEREGALSP